MNQMEASLGQFLFPVRSLKPDAIYGNGDFPYLDIASVSRELKCIAAPQTVSTADAPSRARQLVQKNDVIVSTVRPNLNTVAMVEVEHDNAIASTGFCVLRANPDRLDYRYLYHWISSQKIVDYLVSVATGASYPAVSDKIIKGIFFSPPELKEQKRIAAILDKADSLRHKRQQTMQLANDFLQATFLEIFGDPVTNPKRWKETILKDVADIRSGVTKGKKIDPAISVTVPYMRVANVQDGYLDLTEVQEITVSESDAEKSKLIGGDILLTEGGDLDKLGRGYVWHEEIQNCIHQNHIFSVRVHDHKQINPLFLSALIGSQRGKRYFLKVGKQTTGIATINKTVLSEFVLLIPPYEVQMQYISIVQAVKGIKEKQQWDGFGLYESISQKAFSGQI